MYIIRDIFIAKPGQASKLAKMFRAAMPNGRVMTDLVSDYNQVIMETEVETLADFEREMKEYKTQTDPDQTAAMTGYHDMYYTGRREIFQITE
jgi:hypothetical protein